MPDALEPVAPGPDNQRCFLLTNRTVQQGCEIIAQRLKPVQNIIQVLYLRNGSQATQCEPYSLPDDGGLPDAGIGHAQGPVFLL